MMWKNLPYRPISEFYEARFGHKVYKLPVSVADTCPNRLGIKGMKTCSFCDVWGSAARHDFAEDSLQFQIEKYQPIIANSKKSKHFLIYFQAYTNSFSKLDLLRENFETSLSYPFVKGFVVGTRPDCISQGVLRLWKEMHERSFVSVELGVQSFNNQSLAFFRRGHSAEASVKAIDQIAKQSGVDIGVHLIFGAPNEGPKDILLAARMCNELPITNVKLHNLHVLKNTHLEEEFRAGKFVPIAFEAYAEQVQLFLEHLSPRIFVHRLAAYAPRWNELVSPAWTADKMRTHQGLIDFLNSRHSYQGKAIDKPADIVTMQ